MTWLVDLTSHYISAYQIEYGNSKNKSRISNL